MASRSPKAVVSPHALSQQDPQQVIKSKYSREKEPSCEGITPQLPVSGFEKAGSVVLHYVLTRKADTISKVRKKNLRRNTE